jgi:general secretion pathway protein K
MSYQYKASKKNQEGVVIVLALFIVALVVAMAYTMMARLERDTRRTTLIYRDAQAENYAQGSLAWAIDKLRLDWEKKIPEQVIDAIPIHSPEDTVNGFHISSTIYDMQARFNINTVNQADAELALQRLMLLVSPTTQSQQAKELVKAILDWVGLGNPLNHYADYYLHQPEPYRPAYKPMTSTSELLLIKGMTPALYHSLQPFITALPAETEINVQTASAEVLACLSPTLTLSTARSIVEARKQKPFLTLQQFLSLDAVKGHAIKDSLLVVTSHYFLVETIVTIEKQRLVIYTLLERIPKDNKAVINIRWQSKGIW